MTVDPEATAAEAAELMQASGISQLPVSPRRPLGRQHSGSDAGPPAARRPRPADASASATVMARPLPQLDVGVHLDEAYRLLLAGNSGVLAIDGDKVVDIITRIDLIQYWTRRRSG